MKVLCLLILTLLTSVSVWSQNPLTDSLRRELSKAEADTTIIHYSIDLAFQLSRTSPDSAHFLCRKAYALIPRLEKPKAKIMAMHKVGLGYLNLQELDTALLLLEQAKDQAEEINFKKGLAFSLNGLGDVYRSKNDPEKALQYFQWSLQLHKERGDRHEQTTCLNSIGSVYMELRAYTRAIPFFQQAIQLQQALGNKFYQGLIYQNLAASRYRLGNFREAIDDYQMAVQLFKEVRETMDESYMLPRMLALYQKLGNFGRALATQQKTFDILKAIGNKGLISNGVTGFATVYGSLKDYPRSMEYLHHALDTLEMLGDKYGQTMISNNIGRNLAHQGRYRSALPYLYRSLRLCKELGPERVLCLPLYNLGSTYEKMNLQDSAYRYLNECLAYSRKYRNIYAQTLCLIDFGRWHKKRGEIPQAIAALNEANSIAEQLTERIDINEELYRIYKEQNQPARALPYLERFKSFRDTLFIKESAKILSRIELKHEFEQEKQELAHQQEKETLLLNARLDRQRAIQLVTALALGLTLVLLLIIGRFYRMKRRANKELTLLNAEVTAQKEQLQQLDHIKSSFFTNISHEFRTPLTIIDGMVKQIEKFPKQWLKRGLLLIRRNNDNLLNLVNQIQELRKLETGSVGLNLVQGDIVSYLQYIMESFHSLAEQKGITFHFLNDEMEIIMDYDKEKILRIISNLFSNAIKFSPEGKNIYLMVATTPTGAHTPTGLKIKVRDTGVGIAEAQLPYIFDRFYQATPDNGDPDGHRDKQQARSRRQSEGTGIGLALTKALVDLMKGSIQVESTLGSGTTFTVFLPITKVAPMEEQPGKTDKEVIEAHTMHVPAVGTWVDPPTEVHHGDNDQPNLLLVEDNPDVVEYLESLLGDQYHLYTARDGEEGIETALDKIPDLILTDVMMPGKDGFEVCSTLKADDRTSHIPIVMLTARADVESRIAGLERGADAYLAKPFNEKELRVILEKLFDLRKVLQERYGALDQIVPSEDTAIRQEDTFIIKLRNIVATNLANEEFGIPELCKAVGMSRSQLHLKIKALTNQPTSHFIRMIRLQKAKELLQESNLNIAEVAFDVGFQDPAYFSRTFTEAFGISPSEFSRH